MRKTISVIKQTQENIEEFLKSGVQTDILFRELQRDTIGKSGSSPTWGYVYDNIEGEIKFKGVALHKEFDYDFPMGSYAEKAWSIFGKEIFENKVRVPFIDIVKSKNGEEETISYRLMDNDKEDMIHIRDILFNKFEREELKTKKDIFTIDELLECVKQQVNNEENYKEIEKGTIHVLLLDAITNNGDRHALNWALVRNKSTNQYELAVFDHSMAFIDMFDNKERFVKEGWSSTYINASPDKDKKYVGSSGDKVIQYISSEYPEYFNEFYDVFNKKLPTILEQIKQEDMKIDFRRLTKKLEEKKRFLNRLKNKGEIEYE